MNSCKNILWESAFWPQSFAVSSKQALIFGFFQQSIKRRTFQQLLIDLKEENLIEKGWNFEKLIEVHSNDGVWCGVCVLCMTHTSTFHFTEKFDVEQSRFRLLMLFSESYLVSKFRHSHFHWISSNNNKKKRRKINKYTLRSVDAAAATAITERVKKNTRIKTLGSFRRLSLDLWRIVSFHECMFREIIKRH